MLFAVALERGGPWDFSRDLREQVGFDEHARFMDGLVDEGFIVLGGPLAGDREVLHVISAPSEEAVRERLAQDNWAQNGMLRVKSIAPWTVLLDGRAADPLGDRSNEELLEALDLVLLELERRLLRYAQTGAEIIGMADEGLVLSVRAGARLRQAQSSAAHTTGHLQVVGVGRWTPQSTNPGWSDDPRLRGPQTGPSPDE